MRFSRKPESLPARQKKHSLLCTSPSNHPATSLSRVHDWPGWLVFILYGDRSRIHRGRCYYSLPPSTRSCQDKTPGCDNLSLYSKHDPNSLNPPVDRTSSSRIGNSLRIIHRIYKTEGGLPAFYRGLAPNLIGNSTSWALYFMWYSSFKDAICTYRGREEWMLTSSDYFLASGSAGTYSYRKASAHL